MVAIFERSWEDGGTMVQGFKSTAWLLQTNHWDMKNSITNIDNILISMCDFRLL